MNKKMLMLIFVISMISIATVAAVNSQSDDSRPTAPIDYVLYPFKAVLAGLLFILVHAMWVIPLLIIFGVIIAAAGSARD